MPVGKTTRRPWLCAEAKAAGAGTAVCVCVCVCCGGSLSASKMAADAGQHRELALLLYVKHQLIFVVCRLMKRTGRISVSEFMNFNFISG